MARLKPGELAKSTIHLTHKESKSPVIDHYTTVPLETGPLAVDNEARTTVFIIPKSKLQIIAIYDYTLHFRVLSSGCDLCLPGVNFQRGRIVWPIRAPCPSQVFNPRLFVQDNVNGTL